MGENSSEFLGVILTWLNEKTSKSFVLATLNRLENLPPEVTRAGRFDRVFYVGFPDAKERQQILQLHCARFDPRFVPSPDRPYGALSCEDWVAIIEATHKYVGAELAQIAVEAAKAKYYQSVANYRQLTSPKRDLNSYLQAHPLAIDLPSLLHGKSLVRSLYDRNPEGVFAIENKAAAFAEPASTPQASPFTLEKSTSMQWLNFNVFKPANPQPLDKSQLGILVVALGAPFFLQGLNYEEMFATQPDRPLELPVTAQARLGDKAIKLEVSQNRLSHRTGLTFRRIFPPIAGCCT